MRMRTGRGSLAWQCNAHQTSSGGNAGESTTDLSHMAWTLLGIAGIFEIAFAFGMKWSDGFTRLIPGLFTVATGLSSVFLLSFSLRTLPVGTAYAVWTGIGAAGTAILGIAVLGDSAAPLRVLCIALILAGVIGLKLVSGNGG
jgi:quaternary ammonium compound-resistance protein SugE